MPKTLPEYRAFTVRKASDEAKKDTWTAIGAAWPHRDGKGIDVILDALPLDGHVVLRVNEPRQAEPDPAPQRRSYQKPDQRQNDRRSSPAQRWKRS